MDIVMIEKEQLPLCLEVIHKSFETVARDLGFTEQNCPGHTSFMKIEKLNNFWEWGFMMFGLWDKEELVGYYSLSDKGGGRYELHNLAVIPERRHCGCGKTMLDDAKKRSREAGATTLILSFIEESAILKQWYLSNGFKHIGTEKYEHLPFAVGLMEFTL